MNTQPTTYRPFLGNVGMSVLAVEHGMTAPKTEGKSPEPFIKMKVIAATESGKLLTRDTANPSTAMVFGERIKTLGLTDVAEGATIAAYVRKEGSITILDLPRSRQRQKEIRDARKAAGDAAPTAVVSNDPVVQKAMAAAAEARRLASA